MIDLRSDTVTKPTPEMRKAMVHAEVGDDVYGEDPTVNKLEEYVAGLLGHEAAVFMPSGTMSNQAAIKTWSSPGDEIICEEKAHIYYLEAGAPSALSGVSCKLIRGYHGFFSWDDVAGVLRGPNLHIPPTRLACLENTHNMAGGTVLPVDAHIEFCAKAHEHGLPVHLDGARIWNAAVHQGLATPREYTECVDSVSVCFSKGLGAPVGSALLGKKDFIAKARRVRKMFGGGMRQAGIVAAGALYAVKNHYSRLTEDHENAQEFAQKIADIPGVEVELETVQTNIVIFSLIENNAKDSVAALKRHDVLMNALGDSQVRAVTHLGVGRADILEAVDRIAAVLEA